MSNKAFLPALCISVAIGMSGCASSPSDDSGASRSDSTRTKQEGSMMGAVVGGLLGAALGGDNMGKGALIGAVVGAGLGYVVGDEIAERKEKYASEEDFLDGEIISAQDLNVTAEQYNASLVRDIERLDAQTGSLRSEYAAGRVTRDQLVAERETVQAKIDATGKVLDDLNKEHEIKVAIYDEQLQKRGIEDVQVERLEYEIAQLKQNIDELNQHSQQLASIDERLAR